MNRLFLAIALAFTTLPLFSSNPNKLLIAYFSRGGDTETVAEHIATQTGGEAF